MAEYCANTDLVKIRSDILSLGVTDWAVQIAEAGVIIDRAVDARWYREQAEQHNIDWRETQFDRDKLLNVSDQLLRSGCYKTLELAYMYLQKNSVNDAFEAKRKMFADLYRDEIGDTLVSGLDYDWDDDSTIESSEALLPRLRRLERC